MGRQAGFFEVEERLSGLGDQLEAFAKPVNFEVSRADPMSALTHSDGTQGGNHHSIRY
jgi:transposase, IS5 family